MLISVLLVAHIAVLGYWLGSELVINSTYRYVAYGRHIPFAERNRLMEHVMHVDQHVRYALVLQAGLGFGLATLYGMIPGGEPSAACACCGWALSRRYTACATVRWARPWARSTAARAMC